MKLDSRTEILADQSDTGYENISVRIKTENGTTQVLDLMQLLMMIDNRHWRITGDRSESLYDIATAKLTEALQEQGRADDRASELAMVMLRKQLPFLRPVKSRNGEITIQKGSL